MNDLKSRGKGRRPIVYPPEVVALIKRDYEDERYTVKEVMDKYRISKYLLYKLLRERSE